MITRRRKKHKEHARNFFLVVLAAAMVVIFFNLDIIQKGESVFSKSSERKLNFSGDLERSNYTTKEISRLLKFVKKYDSLYEKITIRSTRQDSYSKIKATTEILFEIKITMTDGTTMTTPTRRCQRKTLVNNIIGKLRKDLQAYKEIKEQGKKVKSLVNTM